MAKKLCLGLDFGLLGPNSSCHFFLFLFFSKIWLFQSLDVIVSYHQFQYQKKTNDPILRKLIDGWTDNQTDAQELIL